ncbi:DUF4097 family beta strand repeat-containing protein [Domibacillus indicus]|uniref:DUF4097 family beta strand repeat-containing protein n=1 Tax=Domibacillus indicus TaxID=1437523 RepID=UPI000617D760|nr:DUF4097 family beta strand repeat-containing protein [Domibacillus indicus]
MIKKLSILALILLLVGGAGSVLTFSRANTAVQVSEEKTFNENSINEVQLDTDNADVNIVPVPGSSAKVELTGKQKPSSELVFRADVEGDTLVVELDEKQKKFYTMDFVLTHITLNVYLPEKTYESLYVKNNNGRVKVSELAAQNVQMRIDNGKVAGEDITSQNVKVEADNGEIFLDHVDGIIEGKVINGRIKVLTEDLDRPMQLVTNNGEITVESEKEPTNTTFDVHKDNGSINILDQYDGNARFGKGENIIKLATNNGKIEVIN